MMYTVKVDTPNVRFGNAMQYAIQGWNRVDGLTRRDLLLDNASVVD
jgi:hypothetical protein